MSYDISLLDPVTREELHLPENHLMAGGTYVAGGTTKAWLNITWNYAKYYYKVFGRRPATPADEKNMIPDRPEDTVGGIRVIYGLTGAESIPILEDAISKLGDDATDNYWESTEGNAKKPLLQLLALARMLPHGVWDGD